MYDLLLEAKQEYEAETESRVVVYILDQVGLIVRRNYIARR